MSKDTKPDKSAEAPEVKVAPRIFIVDQKTPVEANSVEDALKKAEEKK